MQDVRNFGLANGQPGGAADPLPPAGRQHHRDRRPGQRAAAAPARLHSGGHRPQGGDGPHADHPRLAARGASAPWPSPSGWCILVVFLFLRRARAALIPSIAVPVSLIGTFAVMYLAGYSLDNLSLMALTVATGFVVDDAIVVLENISRHIESGMQPFAGGAGRGARNRLHGGVDEPVAGGGVHPHPVHGRHRRPPVPRIRRHPVGRHPGLDGGLAHHHADALRPPAEAPPARSRARAAGRAGTPACCAGSRPATAPASPGRCATAA